MSDTCLNCGTKTDNPKFCTRSCAASHANKLSPKRQVEGSCRTCETPISTSLNYCSSECKELDPIKLARQIARLANTGNTFSQAIQKYRIKRREKAIAYLGGHCEVCGSTKDLDFDHINPITKTEEISRAIVNGWSWKRLIHELDKCQLLCRTHHIEKTTKENINKIPWNKGFGVKPDHGTGARYSFPYACRCDLCKKHKKLYREKLIAYSEQIPFPEGSY